MKQYRFLFLVVLLTLVGRTYADNLAVAEVELQAGESKDIAINLDNPTNKYTAFQFDLVLPDGITIEQKSNGKPKVSLNADRIDDHTLTATDMGSNTYRLLAYSMSNAEFYGTSGALVYVTLKVDENISVGGKTATIKNQVFTMVSGDQAKWDDVSFTISIAAVVVPEITADNKTREYGEDNPTFTYTTSASLNGEPELTTTATKTSPVGEYDIVVGRGTITGDYTAINGKLTITKAPLKISGGTYTMKQGDELPTFVASYSGFKNDETEDVLTKKPTLTTTATSSSVPGTYDVVVSGAEAQNYEITYENGTLIVTVASFIITYIVDGEVYKTYDVEYGTAITPEPEPTKEGYTFSGWSEIPETMPAHDVTVTGSFTVNKYKLTYMVDDVEYKSYEIEFGTTITPEPEPEKEGYIFSGWSEIPETMPAQDVIIYGSFEEEGYEIDNIKYSINGDEAVVTDGGRGSGKVVIPSTLEIDGKKYDVTAIGDNAFASNMYITSVTISDGIKKIGANAFNYCIQMVEIIMGKDVSVIGNKAFANIITSSNAQRRTGGGLKVSCYAETLPETASDAFEYSSISNGTLLVDDNIVNDYKTTEPWSQFGTIMGFNEASGVKAVWANEDGNAQIFSLDGKPMNEPQKGVNIVRMNNGQVRKMVVK